MKLVIDIDKNLYSMILKGDLYMPLGVLSAFQTATPLDKIKAENSVTDYRKITQRK